jgi:NADH dehydrogenase/NADH:ubiquinone oxidoreductase subunit G
MNSFKDKEVARYSDVMLPIASFYETSGSHINIEGVMQSFAAAVSAPSESTHAPLCCNINCFIVYFVLMTLIGNFTGNLLRVCVMKTWQF